MDSKEYSESLLDARTKDYSLHTRKSYISFSAYDLESAFEEGQKNPVWNYDTPEPGMIVLADDLYSGIVRASIDKEGVWKDTKGVILIAVDRWIRIPS